jgi:hypothetical protein
VQELQSKRISKWRKHKDVFDTPGAATCFFVDPFALACDPLAWRDLQKAFREAKGSGLSDDDALLQLGLPGQGGGVVHLTEAQLVEVHTLMSVLEDTLDFSTVPWILGDCLVRATRANARVPQPQ